ncbi:hypothetical protein TRFO_34198 [Tritrichomonas foetus]|uniref:Uncharacterized protein n=1 Tax=Tritrichomonas foetus TaxID=1144522 RepID=A0A1J4JPA7_9EUKA|nr:hypothetical protein TRFO_34198 [Tritrichomonas foetus]|eukprot:OHS99347.1 hypothetical protein TRFO_34198 [Tritrichomonas foetus]
MENGPPLESFIEYSYALEKCLNYRNNASTNLYRLKSKGRKLREFRCFQIMEFDLQTAFLTYQKKQAQIKALEIAQEIENATIPFDIRKENVNFSPRRPMLSPKRNRGDDYSNDAYERNNTLNRTVKFDQSYYNAKNQQLNNRETFQEYNNDDFRNNSSSNQKGNQMKGSRFTQNYWGNSTSNRGNDNRQVSGFSKSSNDPFANSDNMTATFSSMKLD